MFPRKDLSVKQGLPRCRLPLSGHALLFCCVIAFSSYAGVIDHATFSGGIPDSLTVADSIVVAVARPNVPCRAFGPALPVGAGALHHLSDVAVLGNNQFRFFWSDTLGSASKINEIILRRDIAVLPASIDTSANTGVACPVADTPAYLHAAWGNNHFVVSFYQNYHTVIACGDGVNPILNIATGGQGTALCYQQNNTFVSVYIKNNNTVYYKQINFTGSTASSLIAEAVLANDATGSNKWIDPSVIADSSGNLCALWMRGNSITSKKVIYGLFNSDYTKIVVDSFPDSAAGPGQPNFYDNAPVVSYARKKFAAVSWDLSGIVLRFFEIKAAAQVDTSTVRIKSAAYCRYPSIATNGRSIACSWMNYSADRKNVYIRCKTYSINSGAIDLASASPEYPVADTTFATSTLDTTKVFILRSAMDSTGNLAFCWNLHDCAHEAIWANRNLLRTGGSWMSPKDSLPVFPGDTVSFFKGAVALNPGGAQDILDSLFLSVDNGSNWTFFKDNTSLAQEVKGPYKYFNYKIKLKNIDSITTPAVKRATLQWKVKPRLMPLDSVRINGTYQPGRRFGDTIRCFSRCDTVSCRFGLTDVDTLDTIYTSSVRKGRTVSDSVNKFRGWWVSDTIYPLTKTDTIAWRFSAVGKNGWAAQDSAIYIQTRNAVPRLSVQTIRNSGSPVFETGTTRINVQQSDSIEFIYSVQDSNDAGTLARLFLNGAQVDSVPQNSVRHYMFHCATGRPQGDAFRFTAKDADDSMVTVVGCGVNHFPVLDSISVKGTKVKNGDTVRVSIGATTPIIVHGSDADIGYGDSLSYLFRRGSLPDVVQKDSVYAYVPQRSDSLVRIYISDLAGKTDSMRFFIRFPWYETDPSSNNALLTAKKILSDSIALIIGSGKCDTISIPVINTGNDTLSITSLQFKAAAGQWLRMLVVQNDTVRLFDSLASNTITPLQCAPNGTVILRALLYADSLKGDHMAFDSIIIGTDDAMHSFDTLPVRLKYNDLPRIVSVSFDFAVNQPYWLSKSKTAKAKAYVFPPHAKISISFTEPVDSASVVPDLKIYSLRDLSIDTNSGPIPLSYQWSQGKTKVDISPHYSQKSPYFKITPPDGFFIPTDSLKLVVSSAITDTAHTPNGPNTLDLHRIYALSPPADTVFHFKVDSIAYTILSVSPDSGAIGVAPQSAISLTFSSPPFPGTIDTSKVNNKALIMGSSYSGAGRINFDSIYVRDATAFFIPSKKFFYNDTVHCYYRGAWARDSLGYSVDLNKDGIPMSMFDSTSTVDDKQWSFIIKDIVHTGVYPAPNAVNAPLDTFITVSFSDSIKAGIIDTSKKNNRSFQMFSRCSRGAPLSLDSIKISGTKVSFHPANRLYYGDSVFCVYQGLSTVDSAGFAIGGSVGAVFTKDKIQWSYFVKNITFVSALPESSSNSASMHPEILLRFSAPVYRGTFDSDTSTHNRSLRITSTYTRDSALAFNKIVFSSDSTQIHITPKASFFSNDSVHCDFKGFKKTIAYDQTNNLPGDSVPMICAYSWHFFVQNEGFYTYPNPYKPGSDPRHCSANGPCGIWFRNLHILKRGISEVSIKIFNMNAFPIYFTQSAGVRIRFQVGSADLKPEWKWDTRNQHGDLVASGLYFYAIYDTNGSMIMKGKLMIVR
jgi:hypothetical protein